MHTVSRRHKRSLNYPPVVLRPERPEDAARALEALRGGLRRTSTAGGLLPCTPHAFVTWEQGTTTELITRITDDLRENTPAEAGKLRLPAYELVDSLTEIQGGPPADHAYARRRGHPAPAAPAGGDDTTTITAFFLTLPLASVLKVLGRIHRKCWEARWGWRLRWRKRYRRLWPDDFDGRRTYGAALREFANVRRAGAEWDRLLVAALMTDLYGYARQGVLHPGRRRRRPRHVLLLDGTADGTSGAVDDFVTIYAEQQVAGPHPVMVLVAALPPEPGTTSDPHSLETAASRLDPAPGEIPTRIDVALPPAPFGGSVPVKMIWAPVARVRPLPEVVFEATAVVVALWLTGQLAFLPVVDSGPFRDDYAACLTGETPDAPSKSRTADINGALAATEALDMIRDQNERAEKEHLPGRIVTVALLHASPPKNADELRSAGSIPELRGVALAQKALHKIALNDNNGVWVKIQPYDAGVQYKNAGARVKEIIADAGKNPRLIGVTGFTESRAATVEAVKDLNTARIPVVSSTATARDLELGKYYHGAAPNHRREAEVVATFIENANTIRTTGDNCVRAEDVVVVTDPKDIYSRDLGEAFVSERPDSGKRIGYSPGDPDGATAIPEPDLDTRFNVSEVAEAVCARIQANPRTLVYWTSRAREFGTFLDRFQQSSECANRDITVVGGNELTNIALSQDVRDHTWLNLYHTAHVLPADHEDRNTVAEDFNERYAEEFGEDIWLDDGHVALAHDAVRVLAEAASQALTPNEEDLTRGSVQSRIDADSFRLEGATGRFRFDGGSGLRPTNKLLVVLHQDTNGAAPVVICGSVGLNIDAGKSWKQGDKTYDCPLDDQPAGASGD
ncbi:hypothetical protein [Streptomyces sp. NP-1717]|uniref:hypothetical protein n=1 Tax=Streptomyces sp. NP-1717 TaxID=2704470 RepID=UPI001F5D7C00|nr:hypothetical protein [Streptomyces sp. NP-1717]MCI3224524.1 hypothetical protein [Streptomyces sp. NP-1717]